MGVSSDMVRAQQTDLNVDLYQVCFMFHREVHSKLQRLLQHYIETQQHLLSKFAETITWSTWTFVTSFITTYVSHAGKFLQFRRRFFYQLRNCVPQILQRV